MMSVKAIFKKVKAGGRSILTVEESRTILESYKIPFAKSGLAKSENEAIKIAKRECKDPYAQTYLQAIQLAIEEGAEMGVGAQEGLRVQLLYELSNMSYWRGDVAKEVKATIKKYCKIK